MRIVIAIIVVIGCVLLQGCDAIRLAPTEAQKQNAWVHGKTTELAAQCAQNENSSEALQKLTNLSSLQSKAFVAYCGVPAQIPDANTVDEVLSQENHTLATQAQTEAAMRPSGWDIADNLLEIGIGIAAMFGGVYGSRITNVLKDAKTKSKALQEIIRGNELFKQQHSEAAAEFKEAHKNQSVETRQIVAQLK